MKVVKEFQVCGEPLSITDIESDAIKAVMAGVATSYQQKCATLYIIRDLCGYGKTPYRSSRPDDSAFNSGRQWVGNTLMNIINTDFTTQGE